jgi:uncharacterized phage-associated protein
MATASQVAKYLLSLQSEEDGDCISNLKLQKLVYYCQGLYLAMEGKPLFADPIEAWAHGPVVRSLYAEYRDYKSTPIPIPENGGDELTENEKDFVREVYDVFGQFSAWRLREMTHDERPYKETPQTGSAIIDLKLMESFFKTYLN